MLVQRVLAPAAWGLFARRDDRAAHDTLAVVRSAEARCVIGEPLRIGPSFIKIGKAVPYPVTEFERWDEAHLVVCRLS